MNKQRIAKMTARSKHVEQSFKDSKNELAAFVSHNPEVFKDLLKKLICQGLIKLMEAEVTIVCRKSDLKLVQSVLVEATSLYKSIMRDQVKMLGGQEPPCELKIDENNWLPEYSESEGGKAEASCVGGVRLHARAGRIVCSNTLDERLELCYQEAIPQIRKLLFPDYH